MKAMFKSPLEYYVNAIIKQSNRKSLPKVFVKKALALIDAKLDSPCCDGDAVIDLITSCDNNLTLITRKFVDNMPKEGNVHSLERTKKSINKFLGLCCGGNHLVATVDVDTIDYTFNTNYVDEVTSYTVSLFDASDDAKIGSTQIFDTGLNVDSLSGSFTTIDAGTYYIKLVTNYNGGRAVLFTSHDIVVA
jgi:hypothetical protein